MFYNTDSLFPYADGWYMILPVGLPERFYAGDGKNVKIGNEVICFKPNTPDEIKNRFIKDYSKHINKQKKYCW